MDFNPKKFRLVMFVRHGQYLSKPETLTPLGVKQAKITAKALAPLGAKKLYCSTMPRAEKAKFARTLKEKRDRASLTAIRMNEQGEFVLLRFSDCGHLPPAMRTYV